MKIPSELLSHITCDDLCSQRKKHEHVDWDQSVNGWRVTTIGKLINVPLDCSVGKTKEHELAFYIRSNFKGIRTNTECVVGTCRGGKALRIGEWEYRARNSVVFRKKWSKPNE